ncbi:MAG: hypothetical protein LBR47_05870 [Spirochaetaceae bacterium]|jgi:hypothetical protein|nr:hypothetical protein [Spirochaetaceae bacterium]
MQRLELILSQAVESDLIEAFRAKGVGKAFTKIPDVMGQGFSSPKMGDSIWPQLNCIYIIYCEDEEAEAISAIIEDLRKQYPCDGIALFRTA